MKTGLYLSLAVLVAALAVAFWPLLLMPRFWVSAGIVIGMVGTFIFGVASSQDGQSRKE
jgi:hypothetical protein